MCPKCGQYPESEGGIGCTCGKTKCPGCGYFEVIDGGNTHCWMCAGRIEQQDRDEAEADFLQAFEAIVPDLRRLGGNKLLKPVLAAWARVEKHREADRRREQWQKDFAAGKLRLRVK